MEEVLEKVTTSINFEYENVDGLSNEQYKRRVYNRKDNFKRKMKKCHEHNKDDIDYQMCMLVYKYKKHFNKEMYRDDEIAMFQDITDKPWSIYIKKEEYDKLESENQELKKQIEKLQKKENDKLMTIRNILKISIPKTFMKTETIEPKQSFMFKIKKAFN